MITAFGASDWCKEMTLLWAGQTSSGLAKLKADDAFDVYGGFFAQEHTLKASCEDYHEGATTDVEREQEDQKAGKKIKVPLLLIYSADSIGSRYKFPDVWNDWVAAGTDLQHHGLEGGVGHFGVEEAPEECAEVIVRWLKGLNGGTAT